jgi:hypothetical protein
VSGQRASVQIYRDDAGPPPVAVYAVRAAERTRQAIALAAARRKADQRARLRERYGGPPLDPVVVARAAWSALADEGRWGPGSGSPTDRALVAMRTAAPEADEVLGEVALRAAIARRLRDVPCAWCLVPEVATVTGLPEPPLDDAHARLLGRPCSSCLGWMRDRALEEVLAGVSARRPCSRCGAVHRWAPRAVTASAAGPAPTGVLWPASRQPPPAALRAAALPPPRRAIRRTLPGYGGQVAREYRSVAAHARQTAALRSPGRRP